MLLITPIAARAQDGGFPRTVIDPSGAAVIIPECPEVVAIATSDDPILVHLLPADQIRQVEPATADWSGVDLLVINEGDAAAFPALIEVATGAGVPVYRTVSITSLDGWRSTVTGLGQATGREAGAQALIARLDRRLDEIRARVQGEPLTRVLILTPEGYTFGQGTLITSLIEAAGGINAAAQGGYEDYRQINDAAIRLLAPDVILLSAAWGDTAAFTGNPANEDLPAVQHGRVFLLPFSPTYPRDPAAAALALAMALHPAAMLHPEAMLDRYRG
jgi:ABC-type Fe3+-hydroxamate transport system substrate-binding protein